MLQNYYHCEWGLRVFAVDISKAEIAMAVIPAQV